MTQKETMPADVAREIWEVLVGYAFDAVHDHLEGVFEARGLTGAQVMLLRQLGTPKPQRQLARQLSCDPSNITALADALEGRGLLRRITDPSDRRLRNLARTPSGDALTDEVEAAMFKPPEAIGRLSEAEQDDLLRLLRKLFAASRIDAALRSAHTPSEP